MGDGKRGRNVKITDEELLSYLQSDEKPVYTSKAVAETFDVTKPTALSRLRDLEKEKKEVQSMKIGRTTASFVNDDFSESESYSRAEEHRNAILQEWEDRFVGLPSRPWTAIHPNDGEATAGDKVRVAFSGKPGNWYGITVNHDDDSKIEYPGEIINDETQAVITGELYGKPAVPAGELSLSDDYDLVENTGAEIKQAGDSHSEFLLATGPKSHLLMPHNDAVFLKDVSIVWFSPLGEGEESVSGGML